MLTNVGTELTSADDLNKIYTYGKFFCNNGTIAQAIANCPFTAGFTLFCIRHANSSRMQIVIINTDNERGFFNRIIVASQSWGDTPWFMFTASEFSD
ncbi:MAG: pyocin knob domain-containing protein [Lachnospiraceae bacterium]|nr:pyocin knob domain-containing protein [Lachnospiraceae bacterium]